VTVEGIDELENLPLSQLFSGPLVAAIDASIQSQSETVALLLETGFDENGDPVTVAFSYTTTEVDPETGGERRVAKQLEIPLVLFLTLPNLQISRIEETFSAEITAVEETEGSTSGRAGSVFRLNAKPASKKTTFSRKTESSYDLDVTMVAELQNESTGMELLERAASNGTFERIDEARTERLAEGETESTITAERVHRSTADENE